MESLIEQRRVSDAGADPRLSQSSLFRSSSVADFLVTPVRLSIGLEDFEDLKADLIQGFNEVVKVSADDNQIALLRSAESSQGWVVANHAVNFISYRLNRAKVASCRLSAELNGIVFWTSS